jgi:hypothetical protein
MAAVWPKFIAAIALLLGLSLTAIVFVSVWSSELLTLAFIPRSAFIAPPPLPASAYSAATLWLARPAAQSRRLPDDTSGLLPDGWVEPPTPPSRAAVFFVPTTTSFASRNWNDTIDQRDHRARDRVFLGLLASPFNRSQIWAPLYRQAVIGAFLSPSPAARAAVDVAYRDVLEAFETFIAAQPADRPIILAGHNQGALLLLRLLRERVATRALATRIVAVYAIGWPIAQSEARHQAGVPVCTGPDQAGCLMSWTSFATPARPAQLGAALRNLDAADIAVSRPPFVCTNPLTGGASPIATSSANLGTLMPNQTMTGGALVRKLVPARCDAQGLLIIDKPLDLGGYVLPGNNYTAYDIPLFWANVRADVARREAAWYGGRDHPPQASRQGPERSAPHD